MGNSQQVVVGRKYQARFDLAVIYESSSRKSNSEVLNCDIRLFKERSSILKIACIEKENKNDHFSEMEVDFLEKRIASENQSLIKLLGYYSYTMDNSMCGNVYCHCYYLELPIASLKDEIDMRKFLNRPFSELNLWGFLRTMVYGLSEIKNFKKVCRNISASTIYIDSKGYYKISEQSLVKDSTLFDEILLKIYAKDIYLSPQQIEILRVGEETDDTSNPFLSDIFSLGTLLIEMIYLDDQSNMFKYAEEIDVNVTGLKEIVAYREQTHFSRSLIRLVSQMIEREEKDRISLIELQDEVDKNYLLVLQNLGEDVDELRLKDQVTTDLLEYLLDKKNFEKDMKKATGYRQNEEEELKFRRRTFANKTRRYTSRPTNFDEGETLIRVNSRPLMEVNTSIQHGGDVSSTTSSQRSITSMGLLKLGVERIKKDNRIAKINDIFGKLFQLQKEKLILQEQKQELMDIEQKDHEAEREIENLVNKILANQQMQDELNEENDNPNVMQQEPVEEVDEELYATARRDGKTGISARSSERDQKKFDEIIRSQRFSARNNNVQQEIVPQKAQPLPSQSQDRVLQFSQVRQTVGQSINVLRAVLNPPIDLRRSSVNGRATTEANNSSSMQNYMRTSVVLDKFVAQKQADTQTMTIEKLRNSSNQSYSQKKEDFKRRASTDTNDYSIRGSLEFRDSKLCKKNLGDSRRYVQVAQIFQNTQPQSQSVIANKQPVVEFKNKVVQQKSISQLLSNSRLQVAPTEIAARPASPLRKVQLKIEFAQRINEPIFFGQRSIVSQIQQKDQLGKRISEPNIFGQRSMLNMQRNRLQMASPITMIAQK